jgi:riboflavin kinase/FMN adenylyltransferase
LHNLVPAHRGSVATIGTFDGIHRGHRAILAQVREQATRLGLPAVVMIFEPQPREYFTREQAPARLMRLRDKMEAIYGEGIDRIFCLQFNRSLRGLNARDFINRVLVDGIGVRCLVVGDDFRFGCDRTGDFALLQTVGREQGFEVVDTHSVLHTGRRISSTWVRETLEAGDLPLARELLGRPYCISGRVVMGQQLGRQLGIPTANLNLHRFRAPLQGVFVVRMQVDGRWLPGIANVGTRPTIAGLVKPVLEVHLLDWSGELYGKRVSVEFIRKLRDEERFPGVEALVAQIRADIERARSHFAGRELSA